MRCLAWGCSRMYAWKPPAVFWWWWWKNAPPLPMWILWVREFDKDVLKKSMRDIGLTDGRPYDKALTDRAEQEPSASTSTRASTAPRW